MVKLNKNRSENFLAFVSTRARSGSRPNTDLRQLKRCVSQPVEQLQLITSNQASGTGTRWR